jgi:ubiquinone/menaquinone biosynthesis C-methylase UbiE
LAAVRDTAPGRVLGVDPYEPMLAEARRQAVREALMDVEFMAADAQIHSFADAGFDVVLSRFGG